jgi:hypothetical protein
MATTSRKYMIMIETNHNVDAATLTEVITKLLCETPPPELTNITFTVDPVYDVQCVGEILNTDQN